MTDLPTLAATLLANFATVRIPRCEHLWTWPMSDPSHRLRAKLLETALTGETLIGSCFRHCLRCHLLEAGYKAFFDRTEGGGPDGWRLHFFCLDPAATVLHAAGVGEVGPGETEHFDAEEFVIRRLRQLNQSGRLSKLNDWWWWFD